MNRREFNRHIAAFEAHRDYALVYDRTLSGKEIHCDNPYTCIVSILRTE